MKTKFNHNAAINMVKTYCETADEDCNANDLNIALESIMKSCTSTIKIKSDHRIDKRHVTRELIMAVRERCRLYTFMNSQGVVQGSKLGPLHFIIYVADMLTLGLIGTMILYADDTALCYACDTAVELEETMQRDALILHQWLCCNVLTMNIGKTHYMTFGKGKNLSDFNININDEGIKRVTTYKYLGLILDENLSFMEHIDHVKKMIRPFIPLMWRKSKFIPIGQRKRIYFAYVHSHIAYMIPIYRFEDKIKPIAKDTEPLHQSCLSITSIHTDDVFVYDKHSSCGEISGC